MASLPNWAIGYTKEKVSHCLNERKSQPALIRRHPFHTQRKLLFSEDRYIIKIISYCGIS